MLRLQSKLGRGICPVLAALVAVVVVDRWTVGVAADKGDRTPAGPVDPHDNWNAFKTRFNKTYHNETEEIER